MKLIKSRWLLLFFSLTFFDMVAFATIKKDTISTATELLGYFTNRVDSVELYLMPGTYELSPKNEIDSSCGNCEKAATRVNITYGLKLSGNYIKLIGLKNNAAKIVTNSGYGIYIINCQYCELRNLSITGGVRNNDANATDAAIVAKKSYGVIEDNYIYDNIGDSAVLAQTVVGIAGVAMREKAHFRLIGNRIIRNSWDGIAFYRNSRGLVTRNLIDGIDKATGKVAGGGRGVGIGLTHNAKVSVTSNLVKRYWKGIGVFVNAEATIKGNIVEDMVTWGISLWNAGSGNPYAAIRGNVVYKTGACGISITSNSKKAPTGSVADNFIIQTGLNSKYDAEPSYCYQCPIAVHAAPKDFVIKDNILFNNRIIHNEQEIEEIDEMEFNRKLVRGAFNAKFFLWWHQSHFMQDMVKYE